MNQTLKFNKEHKISILKKYGFKKASFSDGEIGLIGYYKHFGYASICVDEDTLRVLADFDEGGSVSYENQCKYLQKEIGDGIIIPFNLTLPSNRGD